MDLTMQPEIPRSTVFIRPQRCENCGCSTPADNNPGVLECRAGPPSIQIFPMPGPNNQVAIQEFTQWPKVRPDHWCKTAWKARIESVM